MKSVLSYSVINNMRLIIFLFLTLLPVDIIASEEDDNIPDTANIDNTLDSTLNDSNSTVGDTAIIETLSAIDTILFLQGKQLASYTPVSDSTNFEQHLCQNPTKALFKSMVLPGWGQLGNRRYFKAALCASLEVWLISSAIKYGREASDFYELYESDTTISGRNSYYSSYINRKDSRNKYRWFVVIVSFLSMFDAYVDAQLSGFPDKKSMENVNFEIGPDNRGGVQAVVSVPF